MPAPENTSPRDVSRDVSGDVSGEYLDALSLLTRAWRTPGEPLVFASQLAAEGRRGYLVDGRYEGAQRPHSLSVVSSLEAAYRCVAAYRRECKTFQVSGSITVIDLGYPGRPPRPLCCERIPGRWDGSGAGSGVEGDAHARPI